jgi:hypothetical protein
MAIWVDPTVVGLLGNACTIEQDLGLNSRAIDDYKQVLALDKVSDVSTCETGLAD